MGPAYWLMVGSIAAAAGVVLATILIIWRQK